MNLLDLPQVLLVEIFEYLSYEEVANFRSICNQIDAICQQVLNRGFNKAVRQHFISFKRIKALLPRRESERRNHYLARHADVLTSIETRISMLSMTYNKYMDLNLCCFIPGRVLDEIFRILRLIATSTKPVRPHEVLQELRDISSMAIEHFDEKIAVTLKKSFTENSNSSSGSSCSSFSSLDKRTREDTAVTSSNIIPSGSSTTHCCDSFRLRFNTLLNMGSTGTLLDAIKKHQQTAGVSGELTSSTITNIDSCSSKGGCPESRATMMYFKKLEIKYKEGIVKMQRMQQIQTQQSRRLQQTQSVLADLNTQVIELKKRLEDVDAKNREISANMNRQINAGDSTANDNAPSPLCKNDDVLLLRTNIKTNRKRRHNDSASDAEEVVVDTIPQQSQDDLTSLKKYKI